MSVLALTVIAVACGVIAFAVLLPIAAWTAANEAREACEAQVERDEIDRSAREREDPPVDLWAETIARKPVQR